jgi:hypothetical protein
VTRNPHAEAAELRARLRETQTRLRLLAAAVAAGDPGAQSLARLLLAGNLDVDGVSQRPPSILPREPEAGTTTT